MNIKHLGSQYGGYHIDIDSIMKNDYRIIHQGNHIFSFLRNN